MPRTAAQQRTFAEYHAREAANLIARGGISDDIARAYLILAIGELDQARP